MNDLKYKVGDRCFYRGHAYYVEIISVYDEIKKIYCCINLNRRTDTHDENTWDAVGDTFKVYENELGGFRSKPFFNIHFQKKHSKINFMCAFLFLVYSFGVINCKIWSFVDNWT